MKKIKIADRLIGEGKPCFIIAEAGSNHDGKLGQAKKLIDIAADAGVNAVKFQMFTESDLTSNRELQKILKKFEFKRGWIDKLNNYAKKRGLLFFSTPFDKEAVDLLDKIDIPAYKIASGDLTNLPLIEYIAKKNKPIILSVGLGNLSEINEALNVIYSTGNAEVALLHCVVSYPTKVDDANLNVIKTLKQKFKIPVGFSDHTLGITIPIAAASLEANIIEKHFTLDKTLNGPDHFYAAGPGELKSMVKGIRDVEASLGSPIKQVVDSEKRALVSARRSVYANVDIPKNTSINEGMLTVLKPAVGIAPKNIKKIVGKKAKKDILKHAAIKWGDII